MSLVSPLFAAAAIVPVTWGIARGERPSLLQVAGVVLTLAGILLISRSGCAQPNEAVAEGPAGAPRSASVCTVPAGMTAARARRIGILLALAAGIGFGLLMVSFDYGGEADEYWTVSAARFSAVLVVLATISLKRPQLHLRRPSIPVLILVGLLLVGANVLFTIASTRGYLSVVAVLGWLSPAFTVAYAGAFLHERLRLLQWFAAAFILAGIVCLALG
jgi:drug/metabolite transporter (DMT)-like permease